MVGEICCNLDRAFRYHDTGYTEAQDVSVDSNSLCHDNGSIELSWKAVVGRIRRPRAARASRQPSLSIGPRTSNDYGEVPSR